MSAKLSFVTVDVFTHVRFAGNPLAIVNVPKDVFLTQGQKQKVAREFNLSETVFLHEELSSSEGQKADIFITTAEIPFGGHPTIGTLCYMGSQLSSGSHQLKLLTKAGLIPATYDSTGVPTASANIPHDVHIHSKRVSLAELAASQSSLTTAINDDATFPLVSIVKGMTFVLVDLPSLEALAGLDISPVSTSKWCGDALDEGWKPSFLGAYYYVLLGETTTEQGTTLKIRTRMIEPFVGEDPATGSAACDLGAYLALRRGGKGAVYDLDIEQGVEMGRKSVIGVSVRLDESGEGVKSVVLKGTAVGVMQGMVEI